MTNISTQLSSYDIDTITQANRSYFCLSLGHTSAEIKCNQVVVDGENRGDEGSKTCTSSCTPATKALKPGFDTTMDFAQMNKNAKEGYAGNIN